MTGSLFAQESVPWCLYVSPTLIAALFAAGGGLAANMITLLDSATAKKEERPDFTSIFFWFPFLILPALGAGLAAAYVESAIALSPIVAINVGLSAPLIIRGMMNKSPNLQPTTPARINPGAGA